MSFWPKPDDRLKNLNIDEGPYFTDETLFHKNTLIMNMCKMYVRRIWKTNAWKNRYYFYADKLTHGCTRTTHICTHSQWAGIHEVNPWCLSQFCKYVWVKDRGAVHPCWLQNKQINQQFCKSLRNWEKKTCTRLCTNTQIHTHKHTHSL